MHNQLVKQSNHSSRFSHDFQSNILLIRHGESVFNYEIQNLDNFKDQEEYDDMRNYIKFTERHFDSDLTDKGVIQAQNAGELLKEMNFKFIFVSPMIRALKTCSILMSQIERLNRNNNDNLQPTVIVHPYIYEKMEDNCDFFPTDFTEKKKEFNKYDWSLIDNLKDQPFYIMKFWDNYVNEEGKVCKTNVETESRKITINHNFYCQMFLEEALKTNNFTFGNLFLREIQKLDKFDTWIESSESTFERNKILNNSLMEYSAQLKKTEKILVIGHSIFFKHLTLKNYNTEEFDSQNFAYLKNCEVISYYL